jgi:hypothetical protein
MMARYLILACATLFLLTLTTQVGPLAFAASPQASYHPEHFSTITPDTDVQLQWPLNNSYAISIDLKVVNSPENQTSIFWGHQFTFMDGEKGYIGFGIGGQVKVATIAVFDATGGFSNSSGGGCNSGVPFSKIGIGWQCFILYNWKLGFNYGLKVTRLSSDSAGNGQWQGSLHDYSTNSDTVIGTIIVPPAYGMIGSSSSTWDEYSTASNCATADTSVIFSSPFAMNAAGNHAPSKAQVTYGNTTCQDSNVQYLGGGAYQADAGRNVTRTTTSQTWLWTQEPALIPQSTSTSTSTTSAISSTQTSTSTATSVTTTNSASTSTAASSTQTPLATTPVPGFPWESIITGIVLGLTVLMILRHSEKTAPLQQ